MFDEDELKKTDDAKGQWFKIRGLVKEELLLLVAAVVL
jgi:hypothetical protein